MRYLYGVRNFIKIYCLGSVFVCTLIQANELGSIIDSLLLGMGDKSPLLVEVGQIKFAPTYKGAYLQEELNDSRFYKDQAAQAGLSRLVSFQLRSQKIISSISVIQNDRSLEFRVLEFAREGRQAIAYQECWQTGAAQDGYWLIQCTLVNKRICDVVKSAKFSWSRDYRNLVEPYRKEMSARFVREFPPEEIYDGRVYLKAYRLEKKFRTTSASIYEDIPSATKLRMERVCKSIPMSQVGAL